MNDKTIGNIDMEAHVECAKYFTLYWDSFLEKNPSMDSEKWMEIMFMVFLSGFSGGIMFEEKRKKSLIDEIIQAN